MVVGSAGSPGIWRTAQEFVDRHSVSSPAATSLSASPEIPRRRGLTDHPGDYGLSELSWVLLYFHRQHIDAVLRVLVQELDHPLQLGRNVVGDEQQS